jgi:lipoprotein-anchoring transpeptidase ErfK/SrfK
MRSKRYLAALTLLAARAPGAQAANALVPATQELAALSAPHQAHSKPDSGSAPLALVQAVRPITEERTVLPVLRKATGADGFTWLQVRLPGRPNGRTGWISQRATTRLTTAWHLVVDRAARTVTAYRAGQVVRVFTAIVGKPTTPTPRGEFFVEEIVQLPSAASGAPFALALSARSNVYQEFDGGPGQIALHGIANIGGSLGTAVSHGCVRLDTAGITWLAWHIRTGVPVTVI